MTSAYGTRLQGSRRGILWLLVGFGVVIVLIDAGRITLNMVLAFGLLVGSVLLHETAHVAAARVFSDSSVRSKDQRSLNPIRHLDLLGSIILPALSVVAGWGYIGWATPSVPDSSGQRGGRNAALLVALAGPVLHLGLVVVAWVGFTLSFSSGATSLGLWTRMCFYLGLTNLWLLFMNLLPVPPLDGSVVLERMLPSTAWPRYLRLRPYLFPGLLGIVAASVALNLGLLEHFGNWLADSWWSVLTL